MCPNPKITVSVCVKNAEKNIKNALMSIMYQDYSHDLLKIIIVDGHSIDNTINIIHNVLDNRDIKYEILYENEGLGKARQIALDCAMGDYIIWVDSDVILKNDYITKMVLFMVQNPKVALATGRFSLWKDNNIITFLESILWVAGDYRKKMMLNSDPRRNCIAGSIYRIKAIKKVGRFDVKIKGAGEDVDIGYKIKTSGWITKFGVNALLKHKGKDSWKSIWNQNSWYGYGNHYILHKYKEKIPTSSFLDGLENFVIAYRLSKRKICILIPFYYLITKIAWLFGFTKAHLDRYGHQNNKV